MAFDAVEPIGDWRLDYLNAMQCTLHANMNRRPGKKPFEPKDFMPFLPRPTMTQDQMENQFLAWVQSVNEKQ